MTKWLAGHGAICGVEMDHPPLNYGSFGIRVCGNLQHKLITMGLDTKWHHSLTNLPGIPLVTAE